MFDWRLFITLMVISLPGIIYIIPASRKLYASIKQRLPSGKKIPPENQFVLISAIQTFIIVAIAAAVGTALHHKINLYAPALEALSQQQNFWHALQPQLIPALKVSIGSSILFLLAYYFIFRPNLDLQTVTNMEKLRMKVGIFGRVFYGGVVEEIICRWGLMSLLVWIGLILFQNLAPYVYWVAILLSGLLFGLGHLPGYLSFGCKKTAFFISTVIILNLWASLIFGWLYWQYGLCSAILAHAIFHLMWYPFDLVFARE